MFDRQRVFGTVWVILGFSLRVCGELDIAVIGFTLEGISICVLGDMGRSVCVPGEPRGELDIVSAVVIRFALQGVAQIT